MTVLDPDYEAILKKLQSIAEASGLFGGVKRYEPRGQPANGLQLSLIAGPMTAIQSSGLNNASLRWQIDGMIYLPMHLDPPENIDVMLTQAGAGYMKELAGQFTLGGLVRCIDLFGSDGERMTATPGYLDRDGKIYRVERLMIPLLINQKWTLTP